MQTIRRHILSVLNLHAPLKRKLFIANHSQYVVMPHMYYLEKSNYEKV